MENDPFIDDDEWTHMINDEIKDVHAQIANVNDGELLATVAPTLTQVGDNAYQLPSDFLRLVDVNIFTSSRWIPVDQSDVQEYYQLLSDPFTGDYGVQYFLHLNVDQDRYELFVFPAKDPDVLGVRYIQSAPVLSVGSDTLNWPSNWHEAVAAGAAAKALIKEESDPSGQISSYNGAMRRILKDVRAQKVAEVKTIRDVSNRSSRRRRWRLPRIY